MKNWIKTQFRNTNWYRIWNIWMVAYGIGLFIKVVLFAVEGNVDAMLAQFSAFLWFCFAYLGWHFSWKLTESAKDCLEGWGETIDAWKKSEAESMELLENQNELIYKQRKLINKYQAKDLQK